MANNIFNELCRRDQEDRRAGRDSAWHDITELAEEVRAFDNRRDVAYIAEVILQDESGFIERDPHNQNVRLTEPGILFANTTSDFSHFFYSPCEVLK